MTWVCGSRIGPYQLFLRRRYRFAPNPLIPSPLPPFNYGFSWLSKRPTVPPACPPLNPRASASGSSRTSMSSAPSCKESSPHAQLGLTGRSNLSAQKQQTQREGGEHMACYVAKARNPIPADRGGVSRNRCKLLTGSWLHLV